MLFTFKFCRVFISIALTIMLMVFGRLSAAESFLPPDQAFAFSAAMRDGAHVRVSFAIAPDYYMYRDDFTVAVVSPDGAVVQNGSFKLPAAVIKFDENFNKNMAIYHDRVSFDVPINGDGLFKLVVTSRGCADGGLCYPPRKTQVVLTAHAEKSFVAGGLAPVVKAQLADEKPALPQSREPSVTQTPAVAVPLSPKPMGDIASKGFGAQVAADTPSVASPSVSF